MNLRISYSLVVFLLTISPVWGQSDGVPLPCSKSQFPRCDGECSPGLGCAPDFVTGLYQCVQGFPPAGTDLSPSTGIFRVDVPGIGPVDTAVSEEILL